jgi:hypothetical protein
MRRIISAAALVAVSVICQQAAMAADTVINIVSNFNNKEMASQTEFECHDGAIMAGVAFKADFVNVGP